MIRNPEPEIFSDEKLATQRKEILVKEINPDYDEVELFEKIIG
jgi:hypothetical protein